MALDMFGTRLARLVGLSVAECTSVDVSRDFIARTSQLEGFDAGPVFASKMLPAVVPVASGADVSTCVNAADATLIVMLDLWLNNWDRSGSQKNTMISGVPPNRRLVPLDYGVSCTTSGPAGPGQLRGKFIPDSLSTEDMRGEFLDLAVASLQAVYAALAQCPGSLEDALNRIKLLTDADLWACWSDVPAEWLAEPSRTSVVDYLVNRQPRLKTVIDNPNYFPLWR